MRRLTIIFVFSIVAIIYFNSCAPLYVPNVVNTPMLTEKDDVNASVHLGLSGVDVQSAYAVADNIGVMFNGSFMFDNSEQTDNYHKHVFVEMGGGYFKPLGEHGVFEMYGGYGIGKINSYHATGGLSSFSDVYINRFFIQPGIGFTSDYFEAILSPRTVVALISQEDYFQKGYFIEPTVTFKLGAEHVKFIAQIGLSFLMDDVIFNYEPFLFSFGIQASFNGKDF